jgi:hypothetical protein
MVYFSIKKTGRGAINASFLYELCYYVGVLATDLIIQGILGLSNHKKGANSARQDTCSLRHLDDVGKVCIILPPGLHG